MSRRRAYWTCQVAGWGLYALANGALSALAGRLSAADAASTLSVSALGLVLSHGLRAVVRRRGWLTLGTAPLAARLVVAGVGAAALMVAVALGAAYGLGLRPPDAPDAPSAALVLLLTFNWSVLMVGWSTLYAAVHLVGRWQDAERARAGAEAARWRLEAAARDAELRALQAQVNPHFLFNSLNSVRALIAERPDRAQQAVTDLAALLRYSLAAGAEPLGTLAAELEAVRATLALEGVRFDERLRWHVDPPGTCADARVPPFVVQTLVENAVKHGIGTRRAGGEVRVTVRRERACVRVAVENTGTLDATGPLGDGATGTLGATGGVGLANARERLARLLGPDATLSLAQVADETVRAEITLPLGAPHAGPVGRTDGPPAAESTAEVVAEAVGAAAAAP